MDWSPADFSLAGAGPDMPDDGDGRLGFCKLGLRRKGPLLLPRYICIYICVCVFVCVCASGWGCL